MVTFDQLKSKQAKICVVGLGYVGLPLALLLAKNFSVIGFDVDEERISQLKSSNDKTGEVNQKEFDQELDIEFTSQASKLKETKFVIVAVPTPVAKGNIPDLSIVEKASVTVGQNLTDGSVVVYESTVYPGATEEICLPILERESSLQSGSNFKIGYSPERVNPGDKEHGIDKVVKVVSGMDEESAELISSIYSVITKTHKATSIKVAEAAKVIENTQRDLNIALMNELAIIFNKLNIDTLDVLEAAGTKWNFLKFKPGLVGGHCIGVDPYYLTYKAQEVGYSPQVILAGRGINDSMHKFIANQIIQKMSKMGKNITECNFVVLGTTFKENVPDIRNSKVVELIKELKSFGVKLSVYDPLADKQELKLEYNIELCDKNDLPKADALIVAVVHDEFVNLSEQDLIDKMNGTGSLLVDIKGVYNQDNIKKLGMKYWVL